MLFAGCILSVRVADENKPHLHRLVLSSTTSSIAGGAGSISFDGCFKNVSIDQSFFRDSKIELIFEEGKYGMAKQTNLIPYTIKTSKTYFCMKITFSNKLKKLYFLYS